MKTTLFFDMDGTFVDLYGVENWLDDLINERTRPYDEAKPLVNFSKFARRLNKAKKNGYRLAIVSWLSKNGTPEYNARVITAKRNYLKKHLPSVEFDEIIIVPYGTPKQNYCTNRTDVLFDDEKPNRDNWTGKAYEPTKIFEII